MANTHEKAQTLLTYTEKYLESLGMRTAADKCASIEIRKTKDSWYVEDPDLRLGNNECIPSSQLMARNFIPAATCPRETDSNTLTSEAT